MSIIKYSITFFVVLFIEKTLLHLVSIRQITPDLVLILIIIISLREDRSKSTGIGFVAGLIQDTFTTGFLGLSALAKSIIGFLGVFFQQPKRKYNLSYFISVSFVLTIIHEFFYELIYNLGSHLGFFKLLFYYMIPRTLYTVVVSVIVYFLFKPLLWKTEGSIN